METILPYLIGGAAIIIVQRLGIQLPWLKPSSPVSPSPSPLPGSFSALLDTLLAELVRHRLMLTTPATPIASISAPAPSEEARKLELLDKLLASLQAAPTPKV